MDERIINQHAKWLADDCVDGLVDPDLEPLKEHLIGQPSNPGAPCSVDVVAAVNECQGDREVVLDVGGYILGRPQDVLRVS